MSLFYECTRTLIGDWMFGAECLLLELEGKKKERVSIMQQNSTLLHLRPCQQALGP